MVDARQAFDHAVSQGAEPYLGADRSFDMPAIKGIGGSLLYFVIYDGCSDPFAAEFVGCVPIGHRGSGFSISII